MTKDISPDRLYYVKEAIYLFDLPRTTLYRYMNTGVLKYEAPTEKCPHRRILGSSLRNLARELQFKKMARPSRKLLMFLL